MITKRFIYILAYLFFGILGFISNDKGQVTTLAVASLAFFVLAFAQGRKEV